MSRLSFVLVGALSVVVAGAPTVAQFTTVTVETKNKPADEAWKPRETRTLSRDATFPAAKLNRFGGRLDETYRATGFFRTHKRDDGRWTLVDPDGGAFLSIGMNSVQPNPTEGGRATLVERFGDEAGWSRSVARQLKEIGFNTLGCWSAYETFAASDARLPYTTQLNLMSTYGNKRGGTYQRSGNTGYPNDCIFVFDAEFEPFAIARAAAEIGALRDDPYLLGHFSDNELPLRKGMLQRFLALPADDAGHVATKAWWSDRRGATAREPTDADDEAFAAFVADRYYGICARAIRAADPNHLYLGSRLVNSSSKHAGVLRGYAKHCDVLTVNQYGAWTPDRKATELWASTAGLPYMITEWYAKGEDSGLGNASGAGWLVKTQADRGAFYQSFALGLLEDPNCVGFHWFKYIDNDPANAKADPSNRDSNKGIVSNRYEPYPALVEQMTRLNRAAYALRDQLTASRPAR